MRVVFPVLHALGVATVLVACVTELALAVHYYDIESAALTYSRSLPALLCGCYSIAHIALLLAKRITRRAAALFYPLCVLLGATASYFAHGFGKGWAPLRPQEGLYANIFGFLIVGALSAACVLSCRR